MTITTTVLTLSSGALLAAFVGTNVLSIAALTVAVAVVVYVQSAAENLGLWTVYSLLVLLLSARTVVGAQQYTAS